MANVDACAIGRADAVGLKVGAVVLCDFCVRDGRNGDCRICRCTLNQIVVC